MGEDAQAGKTVHLSPFHAAPSLQATLVPIIADAMRNLKAGLEGTRHR